MFKASVLFFFFKASVLYYDQLPVKNCLEVLNQKRKRKSPGGNSFSWMILWSWKHSPEAAFSLPRINLASVLQLPARDGASQNQHGVFQLISVPLHLHLAPSLPLLLPGDCSERPLAPRPVAAPLGLLASWEPRCKGF